MPSTEDLRAGRAALEAALACDPALGGLRLSVMLRARADGIVARAEWDGRSVVVKHFPGPDGAATVRALEAELAHLAPRLSSGRCQVNQCLHASPGAATAILSDLPGDRMSFVLKGAPPAERARMLSDAGRLLLLYGEGRREMGQFGPAAWLRRMDGIDLSALGEGDRELVGRVRRALRWRAPALRAAPVCRAAVHGDFVPGNLNVTQDGVSAFDIQGEARLPQSYDAACFLGWLAVGSHQPPGPERMGVAEADLRAFLGPGLPHPDEHPGILLFLLGIQIARRLVERHADPQSGPAARRAARRYLRGLQAETW